MPLRAVFFAFFLPGAREVIVLTSCPKHLSREVLTRLKAECLQGMPNYADSKLLLKAEKDKAFVFASGGVRTRQQEEPEYLM